MSAKSTPTASEVAEQQLKARRLNLSGRPHIMPIPSMRELYAPTITNFLRGN